MRSVTTIEDLLKNDFSFVFRSRWLSPTFIISLLLFFYFLFYYFSKYGILDRILERRSQHVLWFILFNAIVKYWFLSVMHLIFSVLVLGTHAMANFYSILLRCSNLKIVTGAPRRDLTFHGATPWLFSDCNYFKFLSKTRIELNDLAWILQFGKVSLCI